MQTTHPDIVVQPVAPSFGGDVNGLLLSPETIASHGPALRQALFDRRVLVLRNQRISPAVFAAFATLFGEPDPHHVVAMRHPEHAGMTVLSNQAEPGRKPLARFFGVGWHSDYGYKSAPAAVTMLLASEVPDQGGDTLFADMVAAFAALPPARQSALRQLRVRHHYRWSPDRDDPWARWQFLSPEEQAATPEVVHPLVVRHPETGAESLMIAPYVSGHVRGIEGMAEAEGLALIETLMRHVLQESFMYRHHYRPWDLVIWDNRCTLHCATTDSLPPEQVRRLLRVSLRGRPPVAA